MKHGKSRHVFLFGEPGGGLGIGNKGNIGVGFHDGKAWIEEYGEAVPVGRRTHLAAVVTPTAYHLFIDGKSVGFLEGKLDKLPPTRAPALIGMHTKDAPEGFFHGTVHAMRISKSARYLKGFNPDPIWLADTDTVAIYRFNEGAGTKLFDRSGNGHNGEIENGTWVK